MAEGIKVLSHNRKARHDYSIEKSLETGIVLKGTEVKSIRAGRANLKDSYASIENNELFIYNMHISPYEQGNRFNHEPMRTRKLLVHKKELRQLIGLIQQKGYTLVPLKLYLSSGFIKVEIALAKGKKLYDKRADIAEKTAKREMEKAFKEKQRD